MHADDLATVIAARAFVGIGATAVMGVRSLAKHGAFGAGLYLSAAALRAVAT